jgi:hypothetical protein
MPWFTCPTCQHKAHGTGTPTLPCTNPKPCRGTMIADPPRPPADFGPGHVAERAAERDRTLTSSPPPVVAAAPASPACGAPPELYGEGKTPGAKITGLPTLEAAGAALDGVIARAIELERQLAEAQRDARDFQRAFEALQRRREDAVAEFISGHALRLSGRAAWDSVDSEEQNTWMAEVHHVINKLRADEDGVVYDGRDGHRDPKPENIDQHAHRVGALVTATHRATDAIRVIGEMREVAELCDGGMADSHRAQLVLNTLGALERRLNEAG